MARTINKTIRNYVINAIGQGPTSHMVHKGSGRATYATCDICDYLYHKEDIKDVISWKFVDVCEEHMVELGLVW